MATWESRIAASTEARIAQIGLHGVDLADLAERLQMPGEFRPPHRDPDPVIALAQRADHVSPQKTRSAENRDQCVQIRCHRGPIPVRQIERIARGISGFAIRQPARAVQPIGLRFGHLTSAARSVLTGPGPGGGIGRRAGFRCQWLHGREGSSPFLGTTPDPASEKPAFASRPWQGLRQIGPSRARDWHVIARRGIITLPVHRRPK